MTVSPNILSIVGTGQTIIPPGARAFSVNVISGVAQVQGVTLYPGTVWPTYIAADSKVLLGSGVAVGVTGVGHRTNVFYAL